MAAVDTTLLVQAHRLARHCRAGRATRRTRLAAEQGTGLARFDEARMAGLRRR